MKLAIQIIKNEIAQRQLANKHNHLRKDEVTLEIASLKKVLKKCEDQPCEHPFASVISKCNGEINKCLKCGAKL